MNRPECVEAANPSRRRALATVAAGAAALAAAPLRAQAPDKVQLQLNWFHLADHSPIYLALKKGYFKEEGIDLTVLRGSGSADSAKKIDLGQADVGISDAPTVLTAISKGANLRMVAVVYDKAGNNVFFRKGANIRSPKDLVGKKIAVPPADSHRVLWPAFAAMHGIAPDAVTLVNVKPEGKQAIVAANEVDASFDLYTSYAIWEKVLGKGDVGHLLWADFGLPIYGHTYFVNNELITKNPEADRALPARHAQGLARRQGEPCGVDRRDGRGGAGPGPQHAAGDDAADPRPVRHRALGETRPGLDRARADAEDHRHHLREQQARAAVRGGRRVHEPVQQQDQALRGRAGCGKGRVGVPVFFCLCEGSPLRL
jgi:NitT/TauT family transport system substrate-binding protein